jgi:hypothetical protein
VPGTIHYPPIPLEKEQDLMDDLIEALTILRKYDNPGCPTHCKHDELSIMVDPEKVSAEDIARLDELGLFTDYDEGYFRSFRFGSA